MTGETRMSWLLTSLPCAPDPDRKTRHYHQYQPQTRRPLRQRQRQWRRRRRRGPGDSCVLDEMLCWATPSLGTGEGNRDKGRWVAISATAVALDGAARSAIDKAEQRLLPFLCLCYAVNFLDRVNVGFRFCLAKPPVHASTRLAPSHAPAQA